MFWTKTGKLIMIMKKALFFLQVSNNSNIDQRKLLDYILLNQINQAIIFDVFNTHLASFKERRTCCDFSFNIFFMLSGGTVSLARFETADNL